MEMKNTTARPSHYGAVRNLSGPMKRFDVRIFKDCSFGRNICMRARHISLCAGVRIGDNVTIEAEEIRIGHDAIIEKDTVIRGIASPMSCLRLGDNTFIGFANQILVPSFTMLDFSQLHNSGLHSGYKRLLIGHNCWIGQQAILNATEELTIGNNVRIGTQSQLWTHVASGELLEGCTLFGSKPLVIEDNVWIVGGAVISPGLTLGRNSIIMTGAVVTRDTAPYHTYAGIPAVNITEKLNFWKKISPEEKFSLLKGMVDEFIAHYPQYRHLVHVVETSPDAVCGDYREGSIVLAKDVENLSMCEGRPFSVFDLRSKRYTKKRSPVEIDWIKFTVGYRARFVPYEAPS